MITILTGADYDKGGLPAGWQIHSKDGSPMIEPPHFPLCKDRVRHVGDQVALVIAETYAQAKDAAEQIDVTYKELPAIISTANADKAGSAQVWPDAKNSLLRLAHRRQGGDRRGLRQGASRHQDRPGEPAPGGERHGAARGGRRV